MDRLTAALADRYTLERELGRGGMATVYLAHDIKHDRNVAVKVLRPELAAMIGAERFLTEIKTTANLQHPHIVPLFDSGQAIVPPLHEGEPGIGGEAFLYYVMPFIDGESLRDRLNREKQLPIQGAVRIAREVAAALDYAHRHGVIHRDIKPENILLHDGSALVADFGIALAVTSAGGDRGRLTETGMSVGTPQYMSPEQAMGERDITGQTDIYALGTITYEMLVGEPPFTGPTSQAIVARLVADEPRPLIAQRRSIPPEVEDAVLTALEKLPADRFATPADFARALDAGGPTPGRRHSTARRLPASGPRPWRRLALPVILGVGLIAAGYFLGYAGSAARPRMIEFGRATKVTWDPGLEIEPALSPDGKSVAYASGNTTRMRILVRQVAGGRPIRLTDDSLAVQTDPSWSPDGSRILFLSTGGVFSAPAAGGAARPEMPRDPSGPVIAAAWAPDGRTIAYAVGDSVFIRHGGGVRPLARIAEASLCRWSPQGSLIACASGNSYYSRIGVLFANPSPSRIVLVRVRDGVTFAITDSISVNQSPAWSADGRWLYYISSRLGPRDIFAAAVGSDGRPARRPIRLTVGLGAHTMAVSADGRRFAYAAFSATSNVWSLPFPPGEVTRAALRPVTSGSQFAGGGSVTADGTWYYYSSDVSGNSELYRKRLPDGEPEQLTNDPSDDFAPRPSPNGREVAFHSWRSGSRDIYVLPLDGGPVQRLTESPGHEVQPSWSPDGRALVFSTFSTRGSAWVVRRNPDGTWGTPVERVPFGYTPSWSPDGRWIALNSNVIGGSLVILNPDSGAPRTVLDSATIGGSGVEAPLWSRDSRTIYFTSHDAIGNASVWAIPVTGGTPELLTRFTDPTLHAYRPFLSIGGGRMYVAIQEQESDIWVMDVADR